MISRRSCFRRLLGVAVVPALAPAIPLASGGVMSGPLAFVGERGPALIDFRGESAEAIRRLDQHVGRFNGSIERRAVAVVRDAGQRDL